MSETIAVSETVKVLKILAVVPTYCKVSETLAVVPTAKSFFLFLKLMTLFVFFCDCCQLMVFFSLYWFSFLESLEKTFLVTHIPRSYFHWNMIVV